MSNLYTGKQYKVKVVKNTLIDTAVGNIVEIVNISENGEFLEMKDISTHDWFVLDTENINAVLEEVI